MYPSDKALTYWRLLAIIRGNIVFDIDISISNTIYTYARSTEARKSETYHCDSFSIVNRFRRSNISFYPPVSKRGGGEKGREREVFIFGNVLSTRLPLNV